MNAKDNAYPKNFNPFPFGYHQVVELDIDDLNNFGVGVGRIDGWVVMVPFALGGARGGSSAKLYNSQFEGVET